MKKIIVFGGGYRGQDIIREIRKGQQNAEVIAVADNYMIGEVLGVPIIRPEEIPKMDYDYICLATQMVNEVICQLTEMKVDFYKINTSYIINAGIGAREIFLFSLATELNRKNVRGNVAEAGVLRGDFASKINRSFSNRKLYLFDTFKGFDEKDIKNEKEKAECPIENMDYYKDTTKEIVMSKMLYPDRVQLIKGYVPETLSTIDDTFCFVNLDMDLYQPTKEALRWFFPRVEMGGGILIHDYFNDRVFPNLKYAVIEFCNENGGIPYFPIGDGMSVFIPKL